MATLEKSELDIALERLTPQWLAGFFDGEGCISVVTRRGMPGLSVHLSQAEVNILTLIGMKFGAGKAPYLHNERKGWKRGWCLAFYGASALPFLETIRPHVVLKRKLVDWGIELAKLHGKRGDLDSRVPRVGSGARAMDPKILERRKEIMELVRKENQAGKLPLQ